MEKFYCNICEEEVTLQKGKCPKCNTNWNEIINASIAEDSIPVNVNFQKETSFNSEHHEEECLDTDLITIDSIKNNIDFFLKWASIGKIFTIAIGIIIAIISFLLIESTDGFSLILLVISITVIFAGIILENNLRWKAYMLHTNMNKKNRK